MWIGVISLLPEMIAAGTAAGVFGRAVASGVVTVEVFNPRDFTSDRHRTVDDKPYGGGAGMVMMVEPLQAALQAAKKAAPAEVPVIMLSPQGRVFEQSVAVEHSDQPGLILVCGRYEGIDERFVAGHIDAEWSIGDYVLSGGEIPALVVMDAIARHIPGTLGNSLSIIDESYLDGTLDYPHYTRPVEFEGARVPAELLSGDHRKISAYRRREALGRTFERRPELLIRRVFSDEDRELLKACINREVEGDS
jgi:tRNA (guanine37-N1)-methyltransferase